MAWLKFNRDRNFTVPTDRRVSILYLAGKRYPVKTAWAEIFVAEGSAVQVKTPRRELPMDERFNGADPAAFDRDGKDGPGGSIKGPRPRRARVRRPKAGG